MLQRPGVIAPRPFDDTGGVVQAGGGLLVTDCGRPFDRLFVEPERDRRRQVASCHPAEPRERLRSFRTYLLPSYQGKARRELFSVAPRERMVCHQKRAISRRV